MTGKEIYKIWAPVGARWIDWVRPVPFIAINDNLKLNEFVNFTIPSIKYINEVDKNTAIFVDMPGYESVKEGIALAKLGYRPIPLYNGTNEQEGSISTTSNNAIENFLIVGSKELEKIKLENDAPPAFLLDSNRMIRFKMNVSVFDNSWDIYDQDIPSADYLLKNEISKIIIVGSKIKKDLKIILYKFQKKGIQILYTDGFETPKIVKIKKPFIL